MSDFLSTQRHPAFRNSLLQKLQQPILKLRRCPHSVAATSQLCLLSRKSLSSIETRSLPALTRSHPRHFYVDHSHCPVLVPATLAALPSTRAIETRLLPSALAATHRGFAFYVAFPKSSIPSLATCSMSRLDSLTPVSSPVRVTHLCRTAPRWLHSQHAPFAPFLHATCSMSHCAS